LVILECPYDLWQDSQVQKLFCKMVKLKLKGYQKEYPYGVLPIDTTDFIATHHFLYSSNSEKTPIWETAEPLLAFKTISLSRCTKHNLPFPAQSILKAAQGTDLHLLKLYEILDMCKLENIDLSFGSGWTIDPLVRENRELTKKLKELMIGVLINYYLETQTLKQLCFGVPRFKTDLFFQKLGYQNLSFGMQSLPPFPHQPLLGESVTILFCDHFSSYALELANASKNIWDEKMVLGEIKTSPQLYKEAA